MAKRSAGVFSLRRIRLIVLPVNSER